MKKKFLSLCLAAALTLSLLAGCGKDTKSDKDNANTTPTTDNVSENETTTPATDENEAAVEAYADGNGVYDCHFTEGVATLSMMFFLEELHIGTWIGY